MADNVRSPVVEVSFPVNTTVITYKGQYQYDHGLKLKIRGITSETQPTMHFSYPELSTAFAVDPTKEEDGSLTASIPDVVLMQPKEVRCYVYVESKTVGYTTFEIRFPLIPRARPADISQTPAQNENYNKLVSQLNELIEQSTDSAKKAQNAQTQATSAKEEATKAASSANTAAEKANTAATKAKEVTDKWEHVTFEIHMDDGSLYMVTP